MSFSIFFTLDEATRLIGLKPTHKWRVVNFAQGKEYGIKPSVREAAGSGSRRLYELNDICEIALALRLLETGLRPKVIGTVISQLRDNKDSKDLRHLLGSSDLHLAIIRKPKVGKPLNEKREQVVEWVWEADEAERIRRVHANCDLILVSVGGLFSDMDKRVRAKFSPRNRQGWQ